MPEEFHYGGQAVIEGVMIRGRDGVAIATRQPDGRISTERQAVPEIYRGRLRQTPLVRGVIVLIETLVLGTRALLRSAEAASGQEEEDTVPKGLLWGTVAGSLAFGVALFFVAPLFITRYAIDPYVGSAFLSNLFEGLIRIGIFLAYLKLIGLMPDIKRVFAYHGAEHKAVNAYEAGVPLRVELVKDYATAHPRCGTNFGFIVLVLAIFVFALLGRPTLWIAIVSRVVLIPLIAAIAYEFVKFSATRTNKPLVRILLAPGLLLQSMTTREPDDSQLEAAISALNEAIDIDSGTESTPLPAEGPASPPHGIIGADQQSKEVLMFSLTSSEIIEQGVIPAKYSMDNPNQIGVSPPLNWSGAPEGTRSFALAMVDPDVPLEEEWFPYPIKVGDLPGDLFIHWMLYNIPASAEGLPEAASPGGTLPEGAKELKNNMASPGYLGMGPPPGHKAHKYIFTLYALNTDSLELSPDAGYVEFADAMKGKVLASASLTGYFGH